MTEWRGMYKLKLYKCDLCGSRCYRRKQVTVVNLVNGFRKKVKACANCIHFQTGKLKTEKLTT